jgi:hypothetical protein
MLVLVLTQKKVMELHRCIQLCTSGSKAVDCAFNVTDMLIYDSIHAEYAYFVSAICNKCHMQRSCTAVC